MIDLRQSLGILGLTAVAAQIPVKPLASLQIFQPLVIARDIRQKSLPTGPMPIDILNR